VPDEIRRQLADDVVDQLLAGAKTKEELSSGRGGLLAQLTQRLVVHALEVELTDHVGHRPHREPPGGLGDTRDGSTPKTLPTEHGAVKINTPAGLSADTIVAYRTCLA
jgi:transposase-like protein